ncbi:signal peptidase I [Salimicrobium flavidum]|uniref:Signal peptidase I n=1 Tax=Salimicrobium flavidum TaxID=570947 RepID=A0A1N7IKU1_9BACI|nr:signal peptidase I [Salimicrobium flavidum]SIS37709.1 signal peptidase I [Salimicrobium flavidum]
MKRQIIDWIKALAIAAVLAIIVRLFLFAPVVVEGPSMLPSLHNNDHLIVSKINYTLGSPHRFDIVVFHATERRDYIKRVIGLPGEHVAVEDDQLFIDGEKVEEPFIEETVNSLPEGETYTRDFTLQQLEDEHEKIPEDSVLVLGDNRRNSTDSRAFGVVPLERVVGEAVFSYWPPGRMQWLD